MAEGHQGDVVGVLPQEEGFGGAVAVAADHADPSVRMLKAVAHRAIAQHARSDRRLMDSVRQIDLIELYAGGEDDRAAGSRRAVIEPEVKSVGDSVDHDHFGLLDGGAVLDGMARHPGDQLRPANSVRKSRRIVG
ncbi:hypothetical protein D3C80_1262880 [compost metagenome]